VHLKSKPVIDLVIAGIGAGFIPFLAGWSISSQSLSFPTFLGLTFLVAQAGGHTLHIADDREADYLVGLNTSAVRFGGRVVSRWGFIFFLFSLVLFVISALRREIPLLLAVVPVIVLPVATPTLLRYIAVIQGCTHKPSEFKEMRNAIVKLQICFLAAYAPALVVLSLWHPNY
jgi:4-hydroxybenzoate polyprenyltransferase